MEKKNYIRSIGGVMIIMLAGKLLALAASQIYMSTLDPESEYLNIYSWAITIPNNIFQSFGTALTSVVIPIFAALLVKEKKAEADRFASNVIFVGGGLTLILVAVGMGLSFALPSLTEFSDKAYTALALRIMMPVMLFYCLCYIYQGILQSHGKFRSAALSNLPSGIMIIAYIFIYRQFLSSRVSNKAAVTGLLIVTAAGLFMQFAVLIIPARRAGFRPKPVFNLRDPDLRQAGRMTVPIILGASAYQLNMFFNNTMMTNVAPDKVTLFNFVQNLIISSVMTMVLAITSVMYPTLTKQIAAGDDQGFKSTLSATMGGTFFILAPLTAGLIALRLPFLSLISMHGEVSYQNILTETGFLLMYSLCIVFMGFKEIADRAFYSMKSTKVSAVTGVLIMAVNVILGFVLSRYTPLGANGIPLAYSIAAAAGTLFLLFMLRRRIGAFGNRLTETLIKSAAAAAAMGGAVYGAYALLSRGGLDGSSVGRRLICTVVPTVCGIAVYFVLSLILKTPPMASFRDKLFGKK
ncbi:MAG: polysaccharide biosynthesis C-terminal domain-containing protein [Clostridia bacterium]|nr:polysaccharide biosynthesis C-terminal domain-containing protein [Clostridia bacterium]